MAYKLGDVGLVEKFINLVAGDRYSFEYSVETEDSVARYQKSLLDPEILDDSVGGQFEGILFFKKVHLGAGLDIKIGPAVVKDDGEGNIINSAGEIIGSIDYSTGEYSFSHPYVNQRAYAYYGSGEVDIYTLPMMAGIEIKEAYKEYIVQVQSFFSLERTGVYDSPTIEKILAYQREYKLRPTGRLNVATMGRLRISGLRIKGGPTVD